MTYFIWALTQENLIMLHVNNKGADQHAQLHGLISAFVVLSLVRMMAKLATHKINDILANLCSCAGWFELCQATLKKNENWFSRPIIAKCRSKVLQNTPRGAFCKTFYLH